MKTVFLFALTIFGMVLGVYCAESPAMSTDVAVTIFSIVCVLIGAGILNYGLYKAAERSGEE